MSAERITYEQIQKDWFAPCVVDSCYALPGNTAQHTETLYGLRPPVKKCGGNNCRNAAVAFLHVRQHDGQHFISTFCDDHLAPNWAYELEQSRKKVVQRLQIA